MTKDAICAYKKKITLTIWSLGHKSCRWAAGFSGTDLVFSNNSELILVLLSEVGDLQGSVLHQALIDTDPAIPSLFPSLYCVTCDCATAIR